MTDTVKFIHTSDVHLGAGGGQAYGNVRDELLNDGFRNVVDLALREAAQALLIAGDFFDNHRVPRPTVEAAAVQIRRFGGPVVLLPGNHDPLDDGRVYHLHDLEDLAPNLRLIRDPEGERIDLDDCNLTVWGRGYFDADWSFRPLFGMPAPESGRRNVAMAHGHVMLNEGDAHRSLPIEPREIEEAVGWDYIALGHWEPHTDVSAGTTTAVYSGAPMPLSETNARAGWAIVVEIDEGGTRWRKARVDPREVVA